MPSRRQPTKEQQEGLIIALRRFGYTNVFPFHGGNDWSRRGEWSNFYQFHRVFYSEQKPLAVWIERERLMITHEFCATCLDQGWYEHSCQFLEELVPTIGQLDAQAIMDVGDRKKGGPWLYIYL